MKAISKLPKRANLEKTGEVVQTEGASRESSRPLQEGNEASVVTIQSVSDVEVPSSLAFTAGSNLGAQLSQHSTAGNGPGCSSQSTCRGQPDAFPGDQRLRPRQSPLRHQAVRHDDRVNGSCSRSRRPDRSLSRSTSRLPRAYSSQSRGKSRSAVRSRSHGRYRSVSTTKSRHSRSNSWNSSRSSSCSLRSHGSRSRRSHSHRSELDSGRRSSRSHRSHQGHHSRSKTVNRRPQGRSRRSRLHGRRHKSRSLSVSRGRSHVSLQKIVLEGLGENLRPHQILLACLMWTILLSHQLVKILSPGIEAQGLYRQWLISAQTMSPLLYRSQSYLSDRILAKRLANQTVKRSLTICHSLLQLLSCHMLRPLNLFEAD